MPLMIITQTLFLLADIQTARKSQHHEMCCRLLLRPSVSILLAPGVRPLGPELHTVVHRFRSRDGAVRDEPGKPAVSVRFSCVLCPYSSTTSCTST